MPYRIETAKKLCMLLFLLNLVCWFFELISSLSPVISYSSEGNWCWSGKFSGEDWWHDMPSGGGWTGDWLLSYRSYHSIWGCDGYFCIQLSALPVWNQGTGVEWQCRSCIWFNTSCFFSVVNPSPHLQTLQKGNAWAVLGFSVWLFWNRKSNYGSSSTNSRSRNGECYGTPALNWISNHGRFFLGHLNPRICLNWNV